MGERLLPAYHYIGHPGQLSLITSLGRETKTGQRAVIYSADGELRTGIHGSFDLWMHV